MTDWNYGLLYSDKIGTSSYPEEESCEVKYRIHCCSVFAGMLEHRFTFQLYLITRPHLPAIFIFK